MRDGDARPALRRRRSGCCRRLPRPAGAAGTRALRDRRGALRLAVGPRLPARIPAAGGPARALPRRAAHRAHRHRRPRRPGARSSTRLALGRGRIFIAGFDRPNIRYRSCRSTSRRPSCWPSSSAQRRTKSGIVYCLAARQGRRDRGVRCTTRACAPCPTTPGSTARSRTRNQDAFLKEDGVVMVATIAFGMGIDKPDVRFVAHLDLPSSHRGLLPGDRPRRAATGSRRMPGCSMASRTWCARGSCIDQGEAATSAAPHRARRSWTRCSAICETDPLPPRRCCSAISASRPRRRAATATTAWSRPRRFDGTESAQKALSAVYRTGQRFGAGHLIDVLRGVETERVTGARPRPALGLRRRPRPAAPGLALRPAPARGVGPDRGRRRGPRGHAPGRGVPRRAARRARNPAAPRSRAAKPARTRAERTAPAPVAPADEPLFQALRRWRLEVARAQGSRPTSSSTTPRWPPSRRRGRRASGRWPESRAWGPPSSSATATRSSTWWRRRADG